MGKEKIGTDFRLAAELLKSGKLVAIPTETVYGLAGNALDEKVVAGIFAAKKRPAFDPMICHLPSLEKVQKYVLNFPPEARKLAKSFWPGPLTLLLPKKEIIPDLVTSGHPTVGIRIPDHSMTRELLAMLDFPLAAPSANPFGYISPTTAQHVADQMGGDVDYILDGGDAVIGIESTIIGFEKGKTIIYRLGGINLEAIEALGLVVEVKAHSTSNPAAPGMLESHYAPRKKMFRNLEQALKQFPDKEIGALRFRTALDNLPAKNQLILSPSGDDVEAAAKLFGYLRKLDEMDIKAIVLEFLPDKGLGRAINDRLSRASAV